MSLHPEPIGVIPMETACVARAAFSKGTVATRLRDEFNVLYQDEDFRELYPTRGQPGRKSYLFAGSDKGAERAAALYSLIESAKLNELDPEAYLRDVLGRIADQPVSRLVDLLPWCWTVPATAQAA